MPEKNTLDSSLRLSELFFSIQGESTYAGLPCIFIRTTGCDLRCTWCDTEYAFSGGRRWRIADILSHISRWPCKLVELTGGEPMLQKNIHALAGALLENGYTVLIETGGHHDLSELDERVIRIVDVKCPGSGEAEKVHWDNLKILRPQDQVKFVIAGRDDYDWAVQVVKKYDLEAGPVILFSPVFGKLPAQDLAEWLLREGIKARMQLQLHKFIWHPDTRGV